MTFKTASFGRYQGRSLQPPSIAGQYTEISTGKKLTPLEAARKFVDEERTGKKLVNIAPPLISKNEIEGINPSIAKINPVGSGLNPVGSGFDPVRSGFDPVGSGLNPVGSGFDSVRSGFDPVGSGFDPVRSGINPSIAKINPVGSGLNPVGSGLNPVGSGLNPVGSGINPSIAKINPVGSGLNPVGSGINPSIAKINPVGSGLNPVGSGLNPVGSGFDPVRSGFDPVGSGFDPVGEVIPEIRGIQDVNFNNNQSALNNLLGMILARVREINKFQMDIPDNMNPIGNRIPIEDLAKNILGLRTQIPGLINQSSKVSGDILNQLTGQQGILEQGKGFLSGLSPIEMELSGINNNISNILSSLTPLKQSLENIPGTLTGLTERFPGILKGISELRTPELMGISRGILSPVEEEAINAQLATIGIGRDLAKQTIEQTIREQASARGLLDSKSAIMDEAVELAKIPLFEAEQRAKILGQRADLSRQGLFTGTNILSELFGKESDITNQEIGSKLNYQGLLSNLIGQRANIINQEFGGEQLRSGILGQRAGLVGQKLEGLEKLSNILNLASGISNQEFGRGLAGLQTESGIFRESSNILQGLIPLAIQERQMQLGLPGLKAGILGQESGILGDIGRLILDKKEKELEKYRFNELLKHEKSKESSKESFDIVNTLIKAAPLLPAIFGGPTVPS